LLVDERVCDRDDRRPPCGFDPPFDITDARRLAGINAAGPDDFSRDEPAATAAAGDSYSDSEFDSDSDFGSVDAETHQAARARANAVAVAVALAVADVANGRDAR